VSVVRGRLVLRNTAGKGSHSQAERISQSRLQKSTTGAVCILDGVNRAAAVVVAHSQAMI
jgi:hypothetical protein